MNKIIYQVLDKFDPKKNYELHTRPQIAKCLSLMVKGDSSVHGNC